MTLINSSISALICMWKMLRIEVSSVDNMAMFIMIRLPLVEELLQEVHILQVSVKHQFVKILSSPIRNRTSTLKCHLNDGRH